MTRPTWACQSAPEEPWRVLVVATEPLATQVRTEIEQGLSGLMEMVQTADAGAAVALLTAHPDWAVPLIVLAATGGALDERIAALDRQPVLRRAALLLLTDGQCHADLARTLDHHRLDGLVHIPWKLGMLAWQARAQTLRWLSRERPDDPRTRALVAEGGGAIAQPESTLLTLLELDAHDMAHRLLTGIERVLGPRPRLYLPAGTRLVHEGVDVAAVFLVLRGRVALDRTLDDNELRLHHDSTGSVVGLLSLAQRERAFFTARATTHVEVVHLSYEQLDRALALDPELGAALAALSIHALAKRLRRADQLQVEKIRLNQALEQERQRLAEALHQLEEARLELIAQARFATLGELAAGIAHDLNNPVTAMLRAVSFLAEDLEKVVSSHPRWALIEEMFTSARARAPRTTAEERSARRRLEAILPTPGLVQRLIGAGIEDPQQARALAADPDSLDLVEAAAGLGTAVRSIEVAAQRMCELVKSLHAYSRPTGKPIADVDLHAGIEDTLRLMAYRLQAVEVECRFGSLPRIRCHPGELNQLWTNLISNALDALPAGGRIELTTDAPDPTQVRVRLLDNGPGIDPAILTRVFEPRFTTKQGTIRFGLGLGLAIAHRIVLMHGGTIELESAPGRTLVSVCLPVAGPPPAEVESATP